MKSFTRFCDERKFVGFGTGKISLSLGKKNVKMPAWKEINSKNWKDYVKSHHRTFCIRTGKDYDLVVLDFDTVLSYERWIREFPECKEFLTQKTRKGFHIYFNYNDRFPANATNTEVSEGLQVDVRSTGGLIYSYPTKYSHEDTMYSYDLYIDKKKGTLTQEMADYFDRNNMKRGVIVAPRQIVSLRENKRILPQATDHAIVQNISTKYLANYDDWIRIVWAMRRSGFTEDFTREISSKADNYTDEGFESVWNSQRQDTLTMATLKYYSRKSDEEEYFEIHAHPEKSEYIPNDDTEMARKIIELAPDDILWNEEQSKLYNYFEDKWTCNRYDLVRKVILTTLEKYYLGTRRRLSQDIKICNAGDETLPKLQEKIGHIDNAITRLHANIHLNGVVAMIKVLISDKFNGIKFDTEIRLFAFNNKCWDFRTGDWHSESKYDYILTRTNNDYTDPTPMQLGKIQEIVESILPNDEIRKSYMSVLYEGMIGLNSEKFVMANGSGRNGKGLITSIYECLLGPYCFKSSIATLTNPMKDGPNPSVAQMDGKRFVYAAEPGDGATLDVGIIKDLTGGERVHARNNYENNCNAVHLVLTMMMECNKKPNINGRVDEALVGRFMDIPFETIFTDDAGLYNNPDLSHTYKRKDVSLKEPAFAEKHRCAFFQYIVNYGVTSIYNPEIIRDRTREYLDNSDVFLSWFTEKYRRTEDMKSVIRVREIYELYKQGDVYNNMTKKDKRNMCEREFDRGISVHIRLRAFYRDRLRANWISERYKCSEFWSCLIGWELIPEECILE